MNGSVKQRKQWPILPPSTDQAVSLPSTLRWDSPRGAIPRRSHRETEPPPPIRSEVNELGFGTHPEAPSSTVKDRGELEPYDSDRITEVDHERVEPEPSTRQFDTIPCPPAVWDDESFEPDR